MMTRFRKITSALIIASIAGAGTAYAAVKYLRDFSAVVGITDNDNTFWCQVVGGCQSTDPLKRVTMAQIWQYIFSKVSGDFVINPSTGVGTLSNTAVTPGTYGDSTHVSQVTLDSKGRATGAANVAIAGGAGGTVNQVKDGTTTVTSPAIINYTAGCVVTNAAGNANVACSGGGGGSGTVNSGTLGQLAWYSGTGTAVSGNPNVSVLGGTLVTNFNAVALPAPPSGTTVAQFGAADGNQTRIVADSFGTGVSSVFTGRSARGTNASKTAVQTNDILSAFTGFGYGATGYSASYRGRLGIAAAENWTDAAQGTRAIISTATNTTTTVNDRVAVENDGGVTVAADVTSAPPTGGSKGPGTVNASSGFYDNGVRVAVNAATVTNTSGPLTLHAPIIGNGSADIKATAAMTNGQIPIGSTGADPVPGTLTMGAGLNGATGAGSFTITPAGRTAVADANCGTLTNANSLLAFTTVLTAPRSCTLPAANTLLAGQRLCFVDEGDGTNPAINGVNTITLNRAASDKINGATSFVMGVSYAAVCLESDASAKYSTVTNQNIASQPATSNNFLTGIGSDGVFTRAQPSVSNLSGFGTGVATALGTNLSAAGGLTTTIASGAKALATSAIASAACSSAQTAAATNTLTTDVVMASFNGDPTAVTGYVPLTAGMLTIIAYPTADTVNFKVCNNTSSSITPGAITLNWRVVR